MLKLSREQFYKNHFSEIIKYIQPYNSVLHITSNLSENKYNQGNYDTLNIDSTKDLYDFLQNINVNLSIVSDRNPAHESIPRIEIPEIL